MNKNIMMWKLAVWWVMLPASAIAQGITNQLDPENVRIATYIWIFGFSLLGWIASDLAKVAGWTDLDANGGKIWKTRLEIIQGFFSAQFAGVCMYFIGKSSSQWPVIARFLGADGNTPPPPDMVLFVLVGGAAFLGSKGLEWLRSKIIKSQS